MSDIVFFDPNAIREVTNEDIEKAVEALDASQAAVHAIAEIGATRPGFLDDGRPSVVFDPHVFHEITEGAFAEARDTDGLPLSLSRKDKAAPGKAGPAQYERLAAAMALDVDAALQASSWGAFSMMGRDFALGDFTDVRELVSNHVSGMAGQMEAFTDVLRERGLVEAIRALPDPKSAEKLAEAFYGKDARPQKVDQRLLSAYKRWLLGAEAASKFVAPLRLGSRGNAVHALQVRLGLPADSVYSPQVVQAVRQFQATAGVIENGIADEATHGKLGLPWPPLP